MARSRPITSPRRPEVRPGIIELIDFALLDFESRVIDGATVYSGWRPGLEACDCQASVLELFCEVNACRFACASARDLSSSSDVHSPAQERPSGDDDTHCTEASAFDCLDSGEVTVAFSEEQAGNRPLDCLQVGLLLQQRPDGAAIESPITLRTWCPHRRSLAA